MRAIYFKTAIVCLTVIAIVFSACKKEISPDVTGIPSLTGDNSGNKPGKKNAGRILFVSNRDGNDEIYSMESDGSDVTRLTFNNVPDGRASWSANGNHIAFASGPVGSRD
ncbi:MAG TPA: hypothetical protein VGD17_18085, partial [Chitinophagaceae bacterium]